MIPAGAPGDTAGGAARTIRLLGLPMLVAADGSVHRLKPVDALLLARLALDGPQPRRTLACWLWPDASEPRATTHLRQRLFRLRRAAGEHLVEGEGVVALAATWRVDVLAAPDSGAAAPGTEPLLGALVFEDEAIAHWLDGQRLALRSRAAQALADAAESAAQQGRLARAIELAERLVDLRPDHEHAYRRLMRLHFQRGDLAAAEAAYARCRAWMLAHQDSEPAAETRELLTQVRRLARPASGEAPGMAREHPASTALPLALLRPPRLMGREAAWAALDDALARDGAALLVGDAGVGKSRLREAYLSARSGWLTVSARPGDAGLAFALAARVLRAAAQAHGRPADAWIGEALGRLVPGWSAGEAAEPDTLRLHQAAEAALDHWQGQGLAGVCIDDAQHADAASLALLASAARPQPGAAVRWLWVARPDDVLARSLPQARPVALPPLDAPGFEQWLDSLDLPCASAAPLHARTGGNPQYALQLLTAAHGRGLLADPAAAAAVDAPPALLALVTDRLTRLAAPARALVRLAACAGEDFSLPLAARVLGRHPAALADEWQEAQAARVLNPEGDGLGCGLLREAAEAWTPPDVARLLHAQIAAALPQTPAHAARRGHHWQAALHWREAAESLRDAAGHAHRQGDTGAEMAHLRQAAECFARVPDAPQAFAMKAALARLKIPNSQVGPETEALCNELAASAVDDWQRATALELRAHLHAERVEPEPALAAAEAALALAGALPDDRPQGAPDGAAAAAAAPAATRLRLLATQRAAQALCRLGRPGEAIARMSPLQDAIGAFDDDRDRLQWQLVLGMALDYADRRSAALALFAGVAVEAEQRRLVNVAADARSQQALALLYLGRLAPSLDAAERALQLSLQAGTPPESLLVDTATLATNHRDLGRFERYFELTQAEPPDDGLVARLRASGNEVWACNAENDLAVAYAWLGRPEMAMRLLDAAAPDIPPLMQAARWVTQARLVRDFGVPPGRRTPAEGVRAALALVDELGLGGRSYIRLAMLAAQARGLPPAEGVAAAAAIEDEAGARENLPLAQLAQTVQLRLHLAADQPDAAVAVALRLQHGLDAQPDTVSLYTPEVHLLVFQALAPTADPALQALAHRTLNTANEWITRTAAAHVPASFRSSFLQRNPVNAEVRRLAAGLSSRSRG